MPAKALLLSLAVALGTAPLAPADNNTPNAEATAVPSDLRTPDVLIGPDYFDVNIYHDEFELMFHLVKARLDVSFAVEHDGEIQYWAPMMLQWTGRTSQQIELVNQLPDGPIPDEEWQATFGQLDADELAMFVPGSGGIREVPLGEDWKVVIHYMQRCDGSYAVRIVVKHRNEQGGWDVVFDTGYLTLLEAPGDPGSAPGDPGRDVPSVEEWLAVWGEISDFIEEAGGSKARAAWSEIQDDLLDDLWDQLGEEFEAMGLPRPAVTAGD